MNGLASNIPLTSKSSKLTWKVQARILTGIWGTLHRKFENETVLLDFPLVRSTKTAQTIHQKTQKEEDDGIFTYQLVPIGHTKRPIEGEWLTIQLP